MATKEKRRSERVIPFVSEEEIVVLQFGSQQRLIAKMMDMSGVGTLVYLLDEAALPDAGTPCLLSLYHQGKVFDVASAIARKSGRLVAFEFLNPSVEITQDIHAKLIRMEIEWGRFMRPVQGK